MAQIDAFVGKEPFPSRASFIVEAINRLVDEIEQREIDRQIVEGYTRIPQTDEELGWARAAAQRSIDAEPW